MFGGGSHLAIFVETPCYSGEQTPQVMYNQRRKWRDHDEAHLRREPGQLGCEMCVEGSGQQLLSHLGGLFQEFKNLNSSHLIA